MCRVRIVTFQNPANSLQIYQGDCQPRLGEGDVYSVTFGVEFDRDEL